MLVKEEPDSKTTARPPTRRCRCGKSNPPLSLIVLLLLAVSVALTSLCAQMFTFTNRLLATVVSPDKLLKAVIYERDGGATTGFNRQVALMKTSEQFPKEEKPRSFFAVMGKPQMQVIWQGTNLLNIRYESGFEVRRKEATNQQVRVLYEEFLGNK